MSHKKRALLSAACGAMVVVALAERTVGVQAPSSTPQTADDDTANPAQQAPPAAGARDRDDLGPAVDWEKQLADSLTGAVLEGTWQMNRRGDDGAFGPLTEPKPDRYNISKAVKLFGERWLITARIGYADKDVYVPVPVRIVPVDGTPVITLDKLDIPGIGRYSSRVVIDGQYYAGTWVGDGYGGILSGRISKPAAAAAPVDAGTPHSRPDEQER